MPSTPVFPPTGPASDDGLAPDRPVSNPPPEGSKWSVGTLVYTRRGLVRLFSWLLWGDFAWQVRDRVLGPIVGLVLKKKLSVSDGTFGLLTGAIPSAIGLFLGPAVSFRSDRLRTARGRRIPFLLVSAPAAAVAIIGMGFGPALGERLHGLPLFGSTDAKTLALIVLGTWYVLYDFSSVITNAMFNALISDTVPHGLVGRFFGLFRAVSLIVAIVFNAFLLATAEDHFQWTFALIAMVYGVGIVSMCLKVREGEYPPPPPVETGESALGRFFKTAGEYFKKCFSQPYYLWFFLAGNLGFVAAWPVNGFTAPFVVKVGMTTADFGWYNMASYIVSLCLAYPLGLLADRLHPLRMSMGAIALYGLVLPWFGYYATTPRSFGIALLVHAVLSGTYFTASASLIQRLVPREDFAQFASAYGIVTSVFNIILPLVLGFILDHCDHDYRLTFYAGSILSFVALGCMAVVYRYWLRYGGPHHFVPPE